MISPCPILAVPSVDQRHHALQRASNLGFFVVRDQNDGKIHGLRINRKSPKAEWPPGCVWVRALNSSC